MLGLVLTLSLALAQDAPADPPPSEAPPARVDPREAEAQALLQLAQRKLDAGEVAFARALLEELLSDYGDTSVATAAEALLSPLLASEEASEATEGRVQLAISQGLLGGLTTGVLIPVTLDLDVDDATPIVASSLLGIGAGIGGSYLYTRNHTVTRGQAWTLALGEGLGLYHGALIATRPDDISPAATGGVLLLSEAVGGLTGAWIAGSRSPSSQDVSLVSSSVSWGAFAGLIVLAAAQPDDDASLPLHVAITDAGVVAGILLAQQHDLSPRRLSLINGAGAAGTVVGTLLALTMDDDAAIGTSILLGSAAGLTAGTISTRSMQREYEGRITLAPPQLRLIPEPDGGRSVEVSMFNGQF